MEKITKKTVEKMSQQLLDVMKKRKSQKLQKMNERNETNNNDFSFLYNDAHLLLNDNMLRNKKYDITTLERNINNLSMKTILYTQYLTPEFCVKYILNDKYASCIEDTYICIGNVLNAQKHITLDDIQNEYFLTCSLVACNSSFLPMI
jgi:hypothetical protein